VLRRNIGVYYVSTMWSGGGGRKTGMGGEGRKEPLEGKEKG
jgi:hypothetical protein